MKEKSRYNGWLTAAVLFLILMGSCSKEKKEVPLPDEAKPTADFSFEQIDPVDPFSFAFKNLSENFQEVRWEFGDDSSSVDTDPDHTFLKTGDFRVKLRTMNGQGYWAQKEMVLEIKNEEILDLKIARQTNSGLAVSLESAYTMDSLFWYKGKGPGAELLSTASSLTINIEDGQFQEYTLKAKTSKGSVAEITKMFTQLGIVEDVTENARLSVMRENGSPESNEGSLKLVDNNINSKFLIPDMSGGFWMKLSYFYPQIINAYTFTSANDADNRDPKSWVLEGSNDSENWVLLDEQQDQVFESRFLTKTYQFKNSEPFLYYRVVLREVVSGNVFQMAEWRVLKVPQN